MNTTPEKNATGQSGGRAQVSKRPARLQHVVVRLMPGGPSAPVALTDVVIFGQEIDALRHIVGKPDWRYVAVAHGQSVAEALKAASSS